jgi:hypothetical protein
MFKLFVPNELGDRIGYIVAITTNLMPIPLNITNS